MRTGRWASSASLFFLALLVLPGCGGPDGTLPLPDGEDDVGAVEVEARPGAGSGEMSPTGSGDGTAAADGASPGTSADGSPPGESSGEAVEAPSAGTESRDGPFGPGNEGGSVTGEAAGPSRPASDMLPGNAGMFRRPEQIRGIYLNAWTAGSTRRRAALIDLVRRTELNTFVIDIKDATGYVSHDSQVPLAREVGATGEIRIRDLPGVLQQLEEAGIYPIARIVVAKDPVLSTGRPDLAIQDSAGGAWRDQDGKLWLNFFDQRVWDYHVGLAAEVIAAGFPEIQWDYVRFPDAPESFLNRAVYPGREEGQSKADAVRAFLGYARDRLGGQGVAVTADVFGVTTSSRRDVGIGQVWESFIDQVDVALPMVYPSHYWEGSFGFRTPNAYPYEIVRRALRDAISRSAEVEGAGATRPWLQDFSLGSPPYEAPEVRAQIQATYDAGIREWILWNPGSRYTESALLPKGGLPSWLEPFMRVGGKVVALSERWEVLGEEPPAWVEEAEVTEVVPDSLLTGSQKLSPIPGLLPLPIPDTGRVAPRRGRGGG